VLPTNTALFFMVRVITLKQLKSLTAIIIIIDMFSYLDGKVITHQTAVRESWVDSRLWQWFLCLLICCVVVVFYLFVQNTLFDLQFCNSLSSVNSFSILNIHVWPIIRVSRYRPSIFKNINVPCTHSQWK